MKMNSAEIQAVFPAVVAEEPPKKRRRSFGSAPGKGTFCNFTQKFTYYTDLLDGLAVHIV